MTPELEHQLRSNYPMLFNELTESFDVGDGWFGLLDDLCSRLKQNLANSGQACKPIRVKEKLGELRFYCLAPHNNPLRKAAIEEAISASAKTCDVCGAAGAMVVTPGWLRTRCEAHPNERLF